ncbi:putative phage lipoprotein [Burkholderia lata]|uniref:Putative phage lipoprotein n=1 Tax=Burkholderia lata (strain ATCC 17760 / DSM 23089 / LMG 22485 / NCIMB 9086 / R18194 / 383) TaxID=482957 RepID=A0A6P2TSX6_BURL3|nr:hypothetical protein [Burkholderia lata]VWC65397.1 putative phage lipoprotein [Burkholderia lata]
MKHTIMTLSVTLAASSIQAQTYPSPTYQDLTILGTATIGQYGPLPAPSWATYSNVYAPAWFNLNGFPIASMNGNNSFGTASALTGSIDTPASDTVWPESINTGVSGYARSASVKKGSVGVYGAGMSNANDTQQWGGNFVATNFNAASGNSTGQPHFLTVGLESDVYLNGLSGLMGTAIGFKVAAAMQSIPAGGAYGIEIAPANVAGTLGWSSAISVDDGPNTTALSVGSSTVAAQQAGSQTIQFKSKDSSGNPVLSRISSDLSGNLQLVSASGLTSAPYFGWAYSPSATQWANQGGYLGWNATGSAGETDLYSSYGGGVGGFNFYRVASSKSATPQLLSSIDSAGNFTTTGAVNAPSVSTSFANIIDHGRNGNDNTPSINLDAQEALNYTASYATHYGFILNNHMLVGGTGDRIGLGSIQTCDATLSGKSCVGSTGVAVAGGNAKRVAVGNYTGENPRVIIPPGLTGPAGAAVAIEANTETHSPVTIRNGLRIADENQSGGTIEHGTLEDAAIAIVTSSSVGGTGYRTGIQFGENNQGFPQYWPILAGGTLLEASNPNVALKYGFDLSGSTGGFSKAALALPQATNGNTIVWGTAGTGGAIGSSATTSGGNIQFTDGGTILNNSAGGTVLNVGGSSGNDVINQGYMTQYSLNGYVNCHGSSGRCTASNDIAAHTLSVSSGTDNTTYLLGNIATGALPGDATGNGANIIGWNRSGSGGETDFINAKGAGNSGGFIFYQWDGSNQTPTAMIDAAGNLRATALLQSGVYTVQNLPAGAMKGSRASVSDATSCTFMGALTGGGTTFCPVIYNGSAWVGG